MPRAASVAYMAWVERVIAPIAQANGLLRAALDHSDPLGRLAAAKRLGQVGDTDPETWRRV
jgi:hypothetical protein